MPDDILLEMTDVNHQYGSVKVLHDINLKVVRGQFVALVGRSGCGKSTFLNAVRGTLPTTSGTIKVDGKLVTGPNRDVGVVPQDYGLYKFLTVRENVALGPLLDQTSIPSRLLKWKWWPLRKKHLMQATKVLEDVGLGHVLDEYPAKLSGGMKQRTAVARTLIMKPKLMMLDEPFGAQDEYTRKKLQMDLLGLYQVNIVAKKAGLPPPNTVIIITHELEEAFYVCDRVIGFSRNWYSDDHSGKVYGATKVWDQHAPVYHPNEPKDFMLFEKAKQALQQVVLSETLTDVIDLKSNPHVSFWEDLKNDIGTGVVMTQKDN